MVLSGRLVQHKFMQSSVFLTVGTGPGLFGSSQNKLGTTLGTMGTFGTGGFTGGTGTLGFGAPQQQPVGEYRLQVLFSSQGLIQNPMWCVSSGSSLGSERHRGAAGHAAAAAQRPGLLAVRRLAALQKPAVRPQEEGGGESGWSFCRTVLPSCRLSRLRNKN